MKLFLVGSTHHETFLSLWQLNEAFSWICLCNFSGDCCRNITWIEETASSVFLCTNESFNSVSTFKIQRTRDGFSICDEHTIGTGGKDPTHLATFPYRHDHNQIQFVVANYSSGSISHLSGFGKDMNLIGVSSHDQPGAAHAHHCLVNTTMKVFYVCDLGVNSIFTYALAEPTTQLSRLSLPSGTGPRHAVLSRCGSWVYVVCELSNQLVIASVDKNTGFLKQYGMKEYSTMLSGADTHQMAAAEILLSVDGRFLYISNRDIRPPEEEGAGATVTDRSSISVFGLLEEGGAAVLLQCTCARGRHPRHMCLSQLGPDLDSDSDSEPALVLLVAHRDSQSVAIFHVDPTTGLLDESNATIRTCLPYCRDPGFLLEVTL